MMSSRRFANALMAILALLSVACARTSIAGDPDPSNSSSESPAQDDAPSPLDGLLQHPRIVNVHEHLLNNRAAEKYRRAAQQAGIETTIFVGSPRFTLYGGDAGFVQHHENNKLLCEVARKYPKEFLAWVTFDPEADDMVTMLADYVNQGATGVKLYVGHSAKTGDGRPFHCMPLDDPRLEALYDYCQTHRIPILLHVNGSNAMEELIRVLDKFPDVPWIVPHFIVLLNQLDKLGAMFEKYPRLMTDISFGILDYQFIGLRQISNNRDAIREFFIKYQDRILFGTDAVITNPAYKTEEYLTKSFLAYRQMLELDHYIFDIVGKDNVIKYADYRGLALPEDVVCKVYHENFERFLTWTSIRHGRIQLAEAPAQ